MKLRHFLVLNFSSTLSLLSLSRSFSSSLRMKLKLFLNSASELKNVNWRHGNLQPYAVAWIDSSGKCSTKVDKNNGENPVWNEKFSIQLPPTSHPDTANLYIDVLHANCGADTKPLVVGSVKLPVRVALNEARRNGKALFSLMLERPSGRPQGSLEIQIEMKDSSIQTEPYGQQVRPLNPNMPNMPGYPANSTQNTQPQNRLVNQPSVGDLFCSAAFGINPSQIKRVIRSQRIPPAAFNRLAHAYTGALNNTGILGGGGNSGDGGFDMGGLDLGGFDPSGLGFGGLDGSGFGGLDLSGIGGLDMSGFGFSM